MVRKGFIDELASYFASAIVLALALGLCVGFCAGKGCDKVPSIKLEWPDGGAK